MMLKNKKVEVPKKKIKPLSKTNHPIFLIFKDL